MLGELEYADQLMAKIRFLLPGGSAVASPENVYLRDQALRTMGDLQAHIEGTENPYPILSDMLAVKHALFDSCFKGISRVRVPVRLLCPSCTLLPSICTTLHTFMWRGYVSLCTLARVDTTIGHGSCHVRRG